MHEELVTYKMQNNYCPKRIKLRKKKNLKILKYGVFLSVNKKIFVTFNNSVYFFSWCKQKIFEFI